MKSLISMTENRGARVLVLAATLLTAIKVIILLGPEASFGKPNLVSRPYYNLPSDLKKGDFSFAGVRIPLDRHDVASRVEEQLNYLLMDRRAALMDILERLSVYGPLISSTLAEEKLPRDMVYLSAILSELSPTSRTKSGGLGWWNLGGIKGNGQSWSSSNEWDDRRDPLISTKLASALLNQIQTKNAKFDWLFSIASFVDGVDRIETIVKKNPGFSFWDVLAPHYSEAIIPRMIALKIINENRKAFDMDAPPANPLKFDVVDKTKLVRDLPLKNLSQWVGATPRSIWELNPGIDQSFGALVKSDRRYPYATFLRVPKGFGQKVKSLMDAEGYIKN